jgi:hypothetical protein
MLRERISRCKVWTYFIMPPDDETNVSFFVIARLDRAIQ